MSSVRKSSEKPLTKEQRLILQDAIDDGGAVECTGIDRHAGYNRRHFRKAVALANAGYGLMHPTSTNDGWEFRINEAGRAACTNTGSKS